MTTDLRERETPFLRFWRALNTTNARCDLPDVPAGRAWRLFVDAYAVRP